MLLADLKTKSTAFTIRVRYTTSPLGGTLVQKILLFAIRLQKTFLIGSVRHQSNATGRTRYSFTSQILYMNLSKFKPEAQYSYCFTTPFNIVQMILDTACQRRSVRYPLFIEYIIMFIGGHSYKSYFQG